MDQQGNPFLYRVPDDNPSADPLLFPLLFPNGDAGFEIHIPLIAAQPVHAAAAAAEPDADHSDREQDGDSGRKWVSVSQFYSFRLQTRSNDSGGQLLLRGRGLLQEYIVTAFHKLERSRLHWVRANQDKLRAEQLSGLQDALHLADTDAFVPAPPPPGVDHTMEGSADLHLQGEQVGRPIMLPSSFTGSPRYMQQAYMDAMSIVRNHGKPDLFITFTCNAK